MTSSVTKPVLYSYYRSSCSYRVRIALNLKNIVYITEPVNLLKGETASAEYKKVNPKAEVPALVIDGKTLVQSLPIIEYLDETHQFTPRLIPEDLYQRYQARMISELIASGIQPYQNLVVLKRIGEEKKAEWAHDFNKLGLDALEKALQETAGRYCVGDQLSIADCCLVPQLYNARRWKVDLSPYPIMTAIDERLNEISAFRDAHPNCQPDFPEPEKEKS